MSVLIKGSKMPESRGTCFVGNRTICKNGCPLVDLGKHGRLVDVTTAYQDTMLYSNRYRESVLKIVDAFTTVVEAEDEQ